MKRPTLYVDFTNGEPDVDEFVFGLECVTLPNDDDVFENAAFDVDETTGEAY